MSSAWLSQLREEYRIFAGECVRLKAERDTLRAEVEWLKARPEQALASMLGRRLFESDAVNYIETSFSSDDYPGQGEIVVTLRRAAGKTPHELRMDAERDRDALMAKLEQLQSQERKPSMDWITGGDA